MLRIAIPTLNRADLLDELLTSLDKQSSYITELLIIDNGTQNINLDKFTNIKDKITLQSPMVNLGVAASWNLARRYFSKNSNDWVLMLNDDINIGDKQLASIVKMLEEHKNKWMLVGPYYWSMYCVHQSCPVRFDENFYPAYFEDNDFYRQIQLLNAGMYVGNIEVLTPTVKRNSMTIEKDPSVNKRFVTNRDYYIQKWGGEPGKEQFNTPFNIPRS